MRELDRNKQLVATLRFARAATELARAGAKLIESAPLRATTAVSSEPPPPDGLRLFVAAVVGSADALGRLRVFLAARSEREAASEVKRGQRSSPSSAGPPSPPWAHG